MTTTTTTKESVFHAGFENGVQVTGWDRRRDKVHSKLKERMLNRNAASDKAFSAALASLRRQVKFHEITAQNAEAQAKILRAANKTAHAEHKFEIKSQAFLEKR